MFIDSHSHLDVPQFDDDRAEVIERARSAGVGMILEIAGSDVAAGSLEKGLEIAERYPFIYAAVGLHPHEAAIFDENLEKTLVDCSRRPKVIAWGEIGLDYYYDNSPREIQRRVFERQLELALELNLPVIIHTRDAEDDTIRILHEIWYQQGGGENGGIIHCFTGSPRLADACLEMGFMISFSGVVTFRKADDLRSVARSIPLERLLIETDCPYLAPMPHRGKRNEPAFVIETAARLAELREIDVSDLASRTSENFLRLFKLS